MTTKPNGEKNLSNSPQNSCIPKKALHRLYALYCHVIRLNCVKHKEECNMVADSGIHHDHNQDIAKLFLSEIDPYKINNVPAY